MTTPFSTAAVLQTVGWTLSLDQDNVWSEEMQLTFEGGREGGIRGNVEHDGDMKEEQWPAPVDSLEVGCRPARSALGEVPGPRQTHLMAQFYFLPLTHTSRQEIGNTWLGGRDDKDTDKEN